jgi:hypothetical protein
MRLDPHGKPNLEGPHLFPLAMAGVPVTRQGRRRRPSKDPAIIPRKDPEELVPSMGAERRESSRGPLSLERPALTQQINDTPVF